jgi:putative endonuclease
MSKTYYVYILAKDINGTLYTGVTNDLERRLYEHQNNLLKGFTEKYHVHKLVWYEETNSIEAALTREKHIKKWKRA